MTHQNNIIYHYCSFDAFLKIVQTKVLWLTDMFLTNDSEEHRWLRKIAAKVIENLKVQPGTLEPDIIELLNTTPVNPDERGDIYLACFSKLRDSLGQWRAYADDGRGVAIGFSRQYMETKREHLDPDNRDLQVLDVVYETEAQEKLVREAIESAEKNWHEAAPHKSKIEHFDFIFRNRLRGTIWGYAARCKHHAFEEEQEVRVVYYPLCRPNNDGDLKLGYRPNRSGITRYYELPINVSRDQPIMEIMLGPKNTSRLSDVERIVSDNGHDIHHIKFSKSDAPYR